MGNPFKLNGDGAPAAQPPALPATAVPRPPPLEVLEEAARTGKGLDQVNYESEVKTQPKTIPWPEARPLEQPGKPFKL